MAQSKALVTHVSLLSTLLSRFQEHVARGLDKKFKIGNSLVVDGRAKKSKGTHGRVAAKTIVAMNEYEAIWNEYPRHADYYESVLLTFGRLGEKCLDDTVNLMLEWLPDHSKKFSTLRAMNPTYGTIEEYAFTTFLRKLSLANADDTRCIDLVRCAVDLAVADAVAYLVQGYDGTNLEPTTAIYLHELGMHFQRQLEPGFIAHLAFYQKIRKRVADQWSFIMSAVSKQGGGLAPSELLNRAAKETSDVDLAHCYRGLQRIQLNLAKSESEVKQFLEQICSEIDNHRSKNLRLELIYVLDGALRSLDWSNNHRIESVVQAISKKATKWVKTDELEGATTRLQATIVAHGGFSAYEEQFDVVIGKKFLKKAAGAKTGPKRVDFLDSVLIVLRGKYVGDRTSWQPRGNAFPRLEPYSSVPLAETPSRLMARLKLVHSLLFQKKFLSKNPDACSTTAAVDIALQMATHSLAFVKTNVLEYLLTDKTSNTLHKLIGMRVLRTLCDKEVDFRSVAGWQEVGGHKSLKAAEHSVNDIDIRAMFTKYIDQLLQPSITLAGTGACGVATEALPIHCITPPFQLPHKQQEFELSQDDLTASFSSLKVSESIQRWHEYVRDPDMARLMVRERSKFSDKIVGESILSWSGEEGHLTLPPTTVVADTKQSKEEAKDRTNLDYLMTLLDCVAVEPTNETIAQFVDADAFIGQLLIHADAEVGQKTSEVLQSLMVNYPAHRGAVLQGMVGILLKPSTAELSTACQETLLSHMVLFADLWVALHLKEVIAAPAEAHEKPAQHMIDEADAVALLSLCHPSASIRFLAIQLSNAVHALADEDSSKGTLASLIFRSGEQIPQKGRLRYLVETQKKVTDEIAVSPTMPMPPVDLIGFSGYNRLWTYVHAEIIHAAAEARLSCLSLVREQILTRIPMLSSHQAFQTRSLSLNYLIAVFASLHRKDVQSQIQAVMDFVQANCWPALLTEGEQFQAVLEAASCTNTSALTMVLMSAWQWFQDLPGKKQKPKARLPLAQLVKRIARHDELYRVEQLGEIGASGVLLDVVNEIHTFLEGSAPPFHANGQLFVCYSQIINEMTKGLFRRLKFATAGPIRQQIQPSLPDALVWSPEARVKALELLHQRGCTVSIPQADITKAVAGIKDAKLKEEKKAELDDLARMMVESARYAFSSLCRLSPIFVNRHIPQKFVDWAIFMEELGVCTLRWLLAFQMEAALPIFIDRCYGTISQVKRNSMFIYALQDQFIPFIIAEDKPKKGLTSDLIQYQRHNLGVTHDQLQGPLSEADLQFSRTVNEHAGRLIFVFFLNTTNPDDELRARSFEALARLIPFNFARDQHVPDSDRSIKLSEELSMLEPFFRSAVIEEYKEAARHMALITSQFKRYTDTVFLEAFSRMFQISSQASKHWAIEMLLPWCSNVNLTEAAKEEKHHISQTPKEFLDLIFKHFTTELVSDDLKIPVQLFHLWEALAGAKPENFDVVIDFLLGEGKTSDTNMTTCSTLVAYLYKAMPSCSLDPLLVQLTLDGDIAKGSDGDSGSFWNLTDEQLKVQELLSRVLSNLTVDAPQLLLPHIHTVLMWAMLRVNERKEKKHLSTLLCRCVKLLMTLLRRANYTDPAVNSRLAFFISCLEYDTTVIRWTTARYEKDSLMAKPNALSVAARLESEAVDGTEIVSVLQACFNVLGANGACRNWCFLALSWALLHGDSRVAVIAHQIASTLLSSCGNVGGVTNLLLRDLTGLLNSLQTALDKSVARAIQAETGTDTAKGPLVTVLRGRVMENFKALQLAVSHLQETGDVDQLLRMFWCCCTVLRNAHPAISLVVYEVLGLVFHLVRCGLFKRLETASIGEAHLSILGSSPDWYFKGLQPLVAQYIFQPSFEQLALLVFVQILNHEPSQLLNPGEGALEVSFVCIIPWLHSQILEGRINQEGLAGTVCKGIIDCLLTYKKDQPLISLFTDVVSGTFTSDPGSFLSRAATVLGPATLPNHSGAVSDLFTVIMRTGAQKYNQSVLLFTQALLKDDGAQYLDNFVNLLKHCCGIAGTTYQGCSDTLYQAMAMTLRGDSLPGINTASQPLKSTQLQTTMRLSTYAILKLIQAEDVSSSDFPSPLSPSDLSTILVPVAQAPLSTQRAFSAMAAQGQMQQMQMQQEQQKQMMALQQSQALLDSHVSSANDSVAEEAKSPRGEELDVDDALLQLDMLEGTMLDAPVEEAPRGPSEPAPEVPSNNMASMNPFITGGLPLASAPALPQDDASIEDDIAAMDGLMMGSNVAVPPLQPVDLSSSSSSVVQELPSVKTIAVEEKEESEEDDDYDEEDDASDDATEEADLSDFEDPLKVMEELLAESASLATSESQLVSPTSTSQSPVRRADPMAKTPPREESPVLQRITSVRNIEDDAKTIVIDRSASLSSISMEDDTKTIVIERPMVAAPPVPVEDDTKTIVIERPIVSRQVSDDMKTIVIERPSVSQVDDDATVVIPRGVSEALQKSSAKVDDDATVVIPRGVSEAVKKSSAAQLEQGTIKSMDDILDGLDFDLDVDIDDIEGDFDKLAELANDIIKPEPAAQEDEEDIDDLLDALGALDQFQ